MTNASATAICAKCGSSTEVDLRVGQALAVASCPNCSLPVYASRYRRIDIGLSEVCNLKCNMCRRPQEKEFMSLGKVRRLLEEAAMIGVEVVSFSGGEPFVHPDIIAILEAALSHDLHVEMVTNGTLLKPEHVGLLEQLRCVTVSIDGTRDIHDYIRGLPGAYERTMRSVAILARSKVKWGTNTVMQRLNAREILATWRAIRAVGCPAYIGFTHVEVVPETAHLQPTSDELAVINEQLDVIRGECAAEGIHFNDELLVTRLAEVFRDKSKRYRPVGGCHIPATFIGVSNYGIFPCWHQGRVIPADSLIEALTSDLCADILAEALDRRCIGCNAANYSWSSDWVDGIRAAAEAGEWAEGVVYLSAKERQEGHLAEGRKSIPLIERRKAHVR